jgi:hypothetical protein
MPAGAAVLMSAPAEVKDNMHPKHFERYVISICLLIIAGMGSRADAATFSITPATIPNGILNTPYSVTVTEPGLYSGSLHWTITTDLPVPVTISPNNSPASSTDLFFTPTATGSYTVIVTVTDDKFPTPRTATITYNLQIVTGGCAFVGTSTGSISFNIIDPSTTPGPITNNSITQQVLFQCDTTVTYSISTNPASPALLLGASSIPFTLGLAAPGQNVTSTNQIPLLTTSSSILIANYQNAPAGSYNSGGLLVTISWTGSSTGSLTATVTATGTVINTCAVSQSPGTLTFDINPAIAGTTNATISPDLQIKCTMNDSVTITASSLCGGAAPKLDSAYPACGGNTIPYTFNFLGNITGQGFGGAGVSLDIGGSANSANYENAPVGNYGDLQTLTITY